MFTLVAKELAPSIHEETPKEVFSMLKEFSYIFPQELPYQQLPMRDIQHAIDISPRATLPNLPHYKMSPNGHAELKRQVDKLLCKGFVHESLSPCAVYSLYMGDGTPKKPAKLQ